MGYYAFGNVYMIQYSMCDMLFMCANKLKASLAPVLMGVTLKKNLFSLYNLYPNSGERKSCFKCRFSVQDFIFILCMNSQTLICYGQCADKSYISATINFHSSMYFTQCFCFALCKRN